MGIRVREGTSLEQNSVQRLGEALYGGALAFTPYSSSHVLIFMPACAARAALVQALGATSRLTLWEPETSPRAGTSEFCNGEGPPSQAVLEETRDVDVVVMHSTNIASMSAEVIHSPEFGLPELVFVVDKACSIQRLALMSRGYRHIIDEDRLVEWLGESLPSLSNLARARRIVLKACASTPEVAEFALGKGSLPRSSLHAAETSFREAFLRALLLEHGSRRKAAEAASVPYRSFCEMLRRLGI